MNWGAARDGLSLLFGAATVAFTGLTALVGWRQLRGAIVFECDLMFSQDFKTNEPVIEASLTFRNGTGGAIRPAKVEIRGVPMGNVLAGNPPIAKHESWPKNVAPFRWVSFDPGSKADKRVIIYPDWASWEMAAAKRPKSEAHWSVIAFVDLKSKSKKLKRFTSSQRITLETIRDRAAKSRTISGAVNPQPS